MPRRVRELEASRNGAVLAAGQFPELLPESRVAGIVLVGCRPAGLDVGEKSRLAIPAWARACCTAPRLRRGRGSRPVRSRPPCSGPGPERRPTIPGHRGCPRRGSPQRSREARQRAPASRVEARRSRPRGEARAPEPAQHHVSVAFSLSECLEGHDDRATCGKLAGERPSAQAFRACAPITGADRCGTPGRGYAAVRIDPDLHCPRKPCQLAGSRTRDHVSGRPRR